MLKEVKRLYDLGFAILWIHEGEKRPVESGWTTGARAPWFELRSKYKDNYNVGVRTGSASKIGENYLAVIDVDIKKPQFKEKAMAKVRELVGTAKCPLVMSGSGNGSCHFYCVTAQPFKMITALKEDGGEVCIYSEGRQMVLPPSITKTNYKWLRGVNAIGDLPLINFKLPIDDAVSKKSASKNKGNAKTPNDFSFEVEEIDLDWVPISDEVRAAIIEGASVTDRSGYLLRASNALMSAGLNQNEILTVLTDPDTFLGEAAYEHAKTSDRTVAARWVWRYTLAKVESERSPIGVFGPITDEPELTFEELAVQNEILEALTKERFPGFYYKTQKGALRPAYGPLMEHFDEVSPFRTIADMKMVYAFNGTHYEALTPIHVKAFAERNFMPEPEEKIRNEFLNKVLANNLAMRTFFTNSTEGKINFKNGVLDVSGKVPFLLSHSPQYGFRGVLPYNYDLKAKCPVFDEWLYSIMLGDKKLILLVQEIMGYIVRGGDYKYHKAFWLGGTGRNGKSTFVDLLKALIGAGNYSTISIKSLMADKFVAADLDGKAANFSEETSPQELSDSGPFKNLTGDGDISAQKKYGDPFHFRNRAKLVMTYNTIPDIKDLSNGMLSRPVIIPFLKTIEENEQDRDIKTKLFAELPGIFNFAYEGWLRLERQNGFTRAAASDLALTKVKEESCNVYQWADNYLNFLEPGESDRKFTPQELYAAYRSHERFSYKLIEFGKRLCKHPEIAKRRGRNNKNNYYFDLEVNS